MTENPYLPPRPESSPRDDDPTIRPRTRKELFDHLVDEMLTEQGCFIMLLLMLLAAAGIGALWYWIDSA